jgi:hypothetical protein
MDEPPPFEESVSMDALKRAMETAPSPADGLRCQLTYHRIDDTVLQLGDMLEQLDIIEQKIVLLRMMARAAQRRLDDGLNAP